MPHAHTTAAPTLTDLLFDKVGVGLCLVAPDDTVVRANAEWLRATGFTAEQVVGEDIIALFPETRDMALAMHARARAGHRVEVPSHAQTVNWRETWWEGSIEPVAMEGGTGLLITAREAGAAVARLPPEGPEARTRQRAEVSPEPKSRAEWHNAVVTGIARIFEKALTAESEEDLGRACLAIAEEVTQSRFGFIGEINPRTGRLDDIAISDPGWDACRIADGARHGKRKVPVALTVHGIYGRVLLDGASVLTNDPRSHRDSIGTPPGHPPLRAFLGVPLIHGGRTWGMVAVGNREGGYGPAEREALEALAPAILQAFLHKRAEAALRDSESFYRQTLESIPGMVFTTRPDGYCDYQSQQWVEYTGVPMSEHVGDGWNKLLHPEDRPRAFDAWRAAVEGRAPYDLEYRVRRRDGAYDWFKVIGRTILDPAGQVVRWFGVALNIEMLKRAEGALRDADRRKDEFLGMLSHELRNPLAPIRNSIYILRHAQPGSEQARRAQSVIERQTEHLTRLVDDLLDVTRIARGKIELRRSRVDLRDVVLHAADDYRLAMQDRGVTFRTSVPDAQIWADADSTRVAQIVGNLIHNAAKFTRRGDEVTLSLETAGGEAVIRVRDTGAGIAPALLPRLFTPFVQGERTLARTEGGLGLGLALVKGITELHGGTVRAESAGEGMGAEFVVRLPLVEAAAPQEAASGRVQPRNGARRVLVVDDNTDAAESLADILGMRGHYVEVAYDGPSAVEKARANPPDVVLCDIGLPGMTGYEVAKALREAGTVAQLLAMSGYAQPEDVNRAVAAGFDGHIAKPCDPEHIERLLA
jgi:PAS domain S-box-containing protein